MHEVKLLLAFVGCKCSQKLYYTNFIGETHPNLLCIFCKKTQKKNFNSFYAQLLLRLKTVMTTKFNEFLLKSCDVIKLLGLPLHTINFALQTLTVLHWMTYATDSSRTNVGNTVNEHYP